MAEQDGPIKKSDIVENGVTQVPYELRDGFEAADKSATKLITDVKKLSTAVPKQNSLTDMQKVLKTLADQEKQIVDLQKKLNDAFKNPAPKTYSNAMAELKAQFKAAQAEMVKIQQTLGEDSKEFADAAAKAGKLKDQLNAVAEGARDASGGSGFERLGAQTGRLGQQLKTLDFGGASATLKQLSTSAKSLTFKEATDGVGGFTKNLASLGKAILTNPLFILAAVVTTIVVAVVKLKDNVKVLSDIFAAFGKAIDFVVQIGKDFLDFIGASSFALEKQTDAFLDSMQRQAEAVKKRYDDEIAFAQAAGKETEELEKQKQQELIKTLVAASKAISQELKLNQSLTDERKKELIERQEAIRKQLDQAVVDLKLAYIKEEQLDKQHNKHLQDAAYELAKFRLEQQIAANDAIAKDAFNSEAKRVKAARDAEQERKALADLTRTHELSQEKLLADEIKLINEKASADKKKADEQDRADEQKIYDDEVAKRKAANEQYIADYKAQFIQRMNILKKAISDEQDVYQRALDNEVLKIQEAVLEGKMTRQQGDEAINKITKQLSDERVQIQINAVKKTLSTVQLSVSEREALEKELYNLQVNLMNALYDQTEDKLPIRLAAIKQAYDQIYGALNNLLNSFTQNRMDQLNAESEAVDKQLKESLAAAGDNKKLQDQLNRDAEVKQKQLDNRKKEEQRKQAQFQKDLSLIQAQIALSQAIVEAYTAGPGIGQALAIATAAAGAIQIAAIAARKIPSYEKGVKNAPGGLSRVSEKGSELMVTPAGDMFLTPDKESFIDVPKGSDIYPHNDMMRILAKAGLSHVTERQGNKTDVIALFTAEVRDLKKVIKNQKHGVIDMKRAEKLLKSGETSIKYLTSTYR